MTIDRHTREIVLYDYWRSSAAYRVRIALALLDLPYQSRPVDLLQKAHREPDYVTLNPQGLVPALQIDGQVMTQSLAIIEYLHATTPGSLLLPSDEKDKQRTRQLSYAIAMEIHPVCNLSVATFATRHSGDGDAAKRAWMQHFIGQGLANFEALLQQENQGPFCLSKGPTMADCCLIPQLYNAERWCVDFASHRRICAAHAAAKELDAFRNAHPDATRPPKD